MATTDTGTDTPDVAAGGKPSKGTPADKRLKKNAAKISGSNIGRKGAGLVTRG